jgi:hypothetical protein
MWVIWPVNGGSVQFGYWSDPRGVNLTLSSSDTNWKMVWE